ncbi:NUDIX domain-containing protein [Microbacterium sp. NPDC087589]|uniref:NUDIX domain-containing protein n=1 Tax=Microbacterium sp. NPDC087589 TaxID=3364191 RepID=UPI00382B566B
MVGSDVVHADRWIRVRADDCRDADERSIAPYYVLEYADWISVLALDRESNAIVVEEYRHGAGLVAVGTIGGGVEAGESPDAAAVRQLREETGYEVPLDGLGEHLAQSYHQLTWYKAMARLDR